MTQNDTSESQTQWASNATSYIAVVGAANVDICAGSSAALALGDSTPGTITMAAGGVARNVAENLSRLAHRVSLISAVGDDPHGQFLLDHTRQAGVDVAGCSKWLGSRTGSYLSMSRPDGSLVAAINDMAILDLLSPIQLQRHAAVLASASACVVDCNLSAESIAWLMQNSNNKPIFVDGVSSSKCVRMVPHLARVHTLKVNRLEAAALTGLPVENAEQALAAAKSLRTHGVENVVVSLGSGGVCWSGQGNSHGHVAALKVNAINSNGAGDALMAALVHGALAGWPLNQSARFGNACAALTMTCSSANHPHLSVASALQLMSAN